MANKTSPVAKVYAKALFELSKSSSTLDAVIAEVKELNKFFTDNKQLYNALSSDAFLLTERIKLAVEFCKQVSTSPVISKLVEILVSKGRLSVLAEIESAFLELLDESQGVVRGTVTTVDPLAESEIAELSKTFSKKIGKKVMLNQEINKEILGGLVVDVGGLTFDGSLKSSIRKIKENLERQSV